MMAAMSTGNPYVIAAAIAVMALMAIFGGDGNGDGDGNGKRKNGVVDGGNPTPDPISDPAPKPNPNPVVPGPTLEDESTFVKTSTIGDVEVQVVEPSITFAKHGTSPFTVDWNQVARPEGAEISTWKLKNIVFSSVDMSARSFKMAINGVCYEVKDLPGIGYSGQICGLGGQ